MKSKQISRVRKIELVLLILAIAGLASFACYSWFEHQTNTKGTYAIVSSHGKVIHRINLDEVSDPYEIRVESPEGVNILQVEPGRIRVIDADCPDKVCIHEGWISKKGRPIACVPHGLSIVIEDSNEEGLDGVTQ